MVNIQDLSLAFGKQVLFEHLNLTLLPNEWVSLLGSSGVGKSTLLRLLAGIETQGVVQGKILFEPKVRIAWMPQKETLYPWLSIVDNVQLQAVLFGRKSAKTTEKAKMLLEKVGMAAHWHKPCLQLSGGQKQRVAIARALVTKPALVLADEPTANLDSKTGDQILALMKDMSREFNTTFIFSTHDAKIVNMTDHRIKILDGNVVEDTKVNG